MKPKLKYNINHLYSLLPRDKDLTWVISELKKEGIPERTFYRDRAILASEESDIPGARLLIYAKLFGVNVARLYNFDNKVVALRKR